MKRRKFKRPLRIIDRRCTRLAYPLIDQRLTNACRRAHPWYDDFGWSWLDAHPVCDRCGSAHDPSRLCVGTGICF